MKAAVEMTVRFKLDDIFGDPNDPEELEYILNVVMRDDQLVIFSNEIGDAIAGPGSVRVLKVDIKAEEAT